MWCRSGSGLVNPLGGPGSRRHLCPVGTVAVVIPCFNDGGTLEAAVASAQDQDVVAEIIVVDDGTTDSATMAVFERLELAGVRIIHEVNQGPALARMTGVRATDADYVFALDADDLLAAGAVRRLSDALEQHPEAAAAWGSVSSFGAVEHRGDRSRSSLDPWELTYQNHLPLSCLYRRSALLETGGWRLPGGYEDWDLWMSFAERGWKGIGIPEVTAHYRLEGGRRLSRSSRRHAERYARLQARHPSLFAARRRNRRSSPAPLLVKLTLPVIDALPFTPTRKRLLGSAISHIAYGSGLGMLVARYRAHRVLRGS
jgi:glycosyltransferase involved in cell wall biosynthesis